MKRILKICLTCFVTIYFVLFSSINCIGYSTIYGFANLPAQVIKGKSFTVSLQVQCNSDVSVVMFTLVHSDELEYKSCKVNDNSCGYIEESYSDNALSVVYINTQGITATDITNLIDVTFKAEDIVTTADVQIYTSYGASSDETALASDNGKEYNIDIVEKVTDNKSADSTRIEGNLGSSSSSKSSSSAVNKEIPDYEAEATEITPSETATVNNIITISNQSDFKLFFAGAIFVVAVVIVVAISYKAGKRRD